MCEVDTYIYEERSFLCPVVRNRSLKIAKIDQHDGIAAGFEITAAILEIVSKSQKQARYRTEKNVSQMCGTKMNASRYIHKREGRGEGGGEREEKSRVT